MPSSRRGQPDSRVNSPLPSCPREEIASIGARPRGLGLLGLLLREPRPVRIKDIAKDPRSVGFPPHHQAMTSFLGVPIISRGRIIGNFYMGDKIGMAEFSQEDEDILTLFAAHAAAKGFAQLLVRKLRAVGDHAGELELAERVSHQIDRMAQLLEQLLDISRIQSGRLALDREALDLHLLVRDVAERVQVANESHFLQVKSCGPATVNADRNRIEQVLTNLLTNAIRYSPAGGQVDVAVKITGSEAQVSVRDRGIGIPHDKQPYVFERFFRAVEGGGGLGLGLYISRGIVEAHGGRIRLQSQESIGSVFYFSLPMEGPLAG